MAIWDIKEQYKQVRSNSWARGNRTVFGGGYTPSRVDTVQTFNIASLGNASDFGNLSVAAADNGAYGNTTRGLFACGKVAGSPDTQNDI